jgi:hypothetical protein
MFTRQNNKRAVETFLVAKSAALYNTAGAGNNITDLTGGVVPKGTTVLADGQIGIFSADGLGTVGVNVAIDTTPTKAEASSIYIAAGLPKDSISNLGANVPYPLWRRPFERSGDISSYNSIIGTYQAYKAPVFSTWMIGAPLSTTGEVNVIDEQEYSIQIAEFGYANDIFYSSSATNVIAGSYVTPNYTALGTTNPVDHLLQNIAYDFNRNSRHLGIYNSNVFHGNANIICLGIGASTATGTAISALTAGSVLTVVGNVNLGGTIVLTQDLIDTITAAVGAGNPNYSNADKIVTINLSTAGTAALGNGITALMFISLDRNPAYVDRIPFLKSTIRAGLTRGFDYATVYSEKSTDVHEGTGTARLMEDQYKKTHAQRLYNLNTTEFPIIEFPTPFTANEKYNQIIIQHTLNNQVDLGSLEEGKQKTIVAIPTSNTTLNTNLQAIINAWFASVGVPALF